LLANQVNNNIMERSRKTKNDSGIYQIESVLNNKIYIGSAISIKRRIKEHFIRLKRGDHVNIILQNHVNKHGLEDLDITVIEYCSKEELIEREQYWIERLNPEFNICKNAGSTLGIKWNEESVIKQRERNLGDKNPMYGVHKYGEDAPAYGLVHSEAARKKQAEATKKRWEDPEYRKEREAYTHSPETLKKMHDTHIGKKQSESEIANKRIRTKNAWEDPAYREAHVRGMKGKKQSEEHVRKNSEAQKAAWARRKLANNNKAA
jgi:group I intron endonuclease